MSRAFEVELSGLAPRSCECSPISAQAVAVKVTARIEQRVVPIHEIERLFRSRATQLWVCREPAEERPGAAFGGAREDEVREDQGHLPPTPASRGPTCPRSRCSSIRPNSIAPNSANSRLVESAMP